jgi:hypothetical protein
MYLRRDETSLIFINSLIFFLKSLSFMTSGKRWKERNSVCVFVCVCVCEFVCERAYVFLGHQIFVTYVVKNASYFLPT